MVEISKSDKMKLDRAIDEFNSIASEIADSITTQVLSENPNATSEEIEDLSAKIMEDLLNEVDDLGSWSVNWRVE